MQISSRFTIAVHTLLCIARFSGSQKMTSAFIAGSVNVNPVVIRRTLGQLKEAGIVLVEAGVGGATLARPAERITLLDVYRAVDCVQGDLFSFHANPNPECPVGRNVHAVLDSEVAAAQHALEQRLSETTIADLDAEVELQLAKEGSRA
ncbi:Rrf2 family transcriptional regulator [Enorma shizhengliae]|uniref:Transcriptional regulator n=1 Tax=Enorma shizhengliae TaxID=2606615 RepID=A0A7K0G817_9ACTN|nr:Rrf2 family transcriptional regulator [Enorma shizhengliae]MRX79369.1 transcriptional regulator [Enorma shizhengliae]